MNNIQYAEHTSRSKLASCSCLARLFPLGTSAWSGYTLPCAKLRCQEQGVCVADAVTHARLSMACPCRLVLVWCGSGLLGVAWQHVITGGVQKGGCVSVYAVLIHQTMPRRS